MIQLENIYNYIWKEMEQYGVWHNLDSFWVDWS